MKRIDLLENIDVKILQKLLKKFDEKDYDLSSYSDKSGNVIECLLKTDEFFNIDYLTIFTYSREGLYRSLNLLKNEIQEYVNQKQEKESEEKKMSNDLKDNAPNIVKSICDKILNKFNIKLSENFKDALNSAISRLYQKPDSIPFHEIEKELISCINECEDISNLNFSVYGDRFRLRIVNRLLDYQIHIRIENITKVVVDNMREAGIVLKDIENTCGDYYDVKITKSDCDKYRKYLQDNTSESFQKIILGDLFNLEPEIETETEIML